MRRKPFGGADPRLMVGAAAEAVFDRLLDSVRRPSALVVLSGEAGTGKTLLLRRLMQQSPGGLEFVLCYSTLLSFDDLLGFICDRLNLNTSGCDRPQRLAALGDYLRRRTRQGGAVVLLVDEAHHLDKKVLGDLLEQVRSAGQDNQALRLVLAGALALEAQLADQPLAAMAVQCRLEPLTEDQVVDYVHRQVRSAGGAAETLFPFPVAVRVARYSEGIPRLINALCDHALVLAQFTGQPQVTEAMIDEVADELMLAQSWPPAAPVPAAPPEPDVEPPPSGVAGDPESPPELDGSDTRQAWEPPAGQTDADSPVLPVGDPPADPAPPQAADLPPARTLPQPIYPVAADRIEAEAEADNERTETLPAMTVDSERTANLPAPYTAGGLPTRRVPVVTHPAKAQPRKGAGVWYAGALLLVIVGGGAWLWYRYQTPEFRVEPQTPAGAVQTPSLLAPDPAGEALRRNASPPQLRIGEARGRADQPIPLAIAVEGDPRDTFTIDIAGLPRGATLNAGRQYSSGTWTLTAGELDGLALRPGGEYDGALTLNITAIAIPPYRGQSAATEAELTVHIESSPQVPAAVQALAPATPGEPEPPAAVAAGPETVESSPAPVAAQPPPSVPEIAESSPALAAAQPPLRVLETAAIPAAPVVTQPTPPLAGSVVQALPEPAAPASVTPAPDPEIPEPPPPVQPVTEVTAPVAAAPETAPSSGAGQAPATAFVAVTPSVAAFMDSGNRLMELGDLASARLFYEAAAQAGDPEAALAVGRTYDPVVLSQRGLRGVYADPLKAARWYHKAREAGAAEAGNRIAALARWLEQDQGLDPEQVQALQRLLP